MVTRISAKVLVVEDELALAQAYKEKLSREGFSVFLALDGRQAVMNLELFIPDVVILDVRLPQMNGDEVLSLMKSQDRWRRIPVIVASNDSDCELIERMLMMGASTFFLKGKSSLADVVDSCWEYVRPTALAT